MLWLVLAAAITVRTIRQRLPFTLTWWSFTFPVGTCVTGTIALAARTDAVALRWATVPLYLLLLGAWAVVAVNTARGAATGRLLRPASPAPEPRTCAWTAASHCRVDSLSEDAPSPGSRVDQANTVCTRRNHPLRVKQRRDPGARVGATALRQRAIVQRSAR